MVRRHLEEWRDRLTVRIPDYGVRRVTELVATVRYETKLLMNNKTESIEVACGLFAIAFGAQLFRPFYEFDTTYYGHLVSIAPRGVWAIVMIIMGVDKILALITGTKWCRRVLAGLMTGVWAFIATICWLSAPANIAPGLYTVIAFLCGWTYVRLGKHS